MGVTHLFDRDRSRVWQPAPDRQSVPITALSVHDQLDAQVPVPGAGSLDLDPDEHVVYLEEPDVMATGPATAAANQRQRLRHANELLRTFTKTA